MDSYRLILADDEAHMRSGLSELFPWREWGIEIAAVLENGLQVLDFLKDHPADAVLTDIAMPQMDGLSLAKALRERHPELRVVLLSAYAEFEYARQAIRYGVSEYLIKPVSFQTLEETFSPPAKEERYEGYYQEVVRRVDALVEESPATIMLQSAAEAVGFSMGHLSRIFHQTSGETFSACVHRHRMRLAARLLEQDQPEESVAFTVGYDNLQSFWTAYRRFQKNTRKEAIS